MTNKDDIQAVRCRIRQLLDNSGLSINRLAGGNPALQRKLQRQINEDAALTIDSVMHLLRAFPDVSANWLLTGEKDNAQDGPNKIMATHDDVTVIGRHLSEMIEPMAMVPVYAVEASANLNTLMTGNDLDNIIATLYVPGIPRIDGATYIRGDSMYPILQSGDMIGFRRLPVSYDSIFYGEMYLLSLDVEGDSYVTVKYLQPSQRGEQYVVLKSANPNHPPKEIHLSSVRSLAQVKVIVHITGS